MTGGHVTIIAMPVQRLHMDEFVRPLVDIVARLGLAPRVIHYAEGLRDVEPPIVLSGTGIMDYAYLERLEAFEPLRDLEPILGICAGAQVLALLRGGALTDGELIGTFDVEVRRTNPLLPGGRARAYFLVTKLVVPRGDVEPLAYVGENVAAFMAGDGTYGVMFHPEVYNEDIIVRFLDLSKGRL